MRRPGSGAVSEEANGPRHLRRAARKLAYRALWAQQALAAFVEAAESCRVLLGPKRAHAIPDQACVAAAGEHLKQSRRAAAALVNEGMTNNE